MVVKSKRPPKMWIRHCIKKVKRAGRKLRSAGAVCANTWYHVMDKQARARAKRRHPERGRGH
jgi:hypothetical protein